MKLFSRKKKKEELEWSDSSNYKRHEQLNNQAGLPSNITHAVAASVFKDNDRPPNRSAIVKIENILTERTTDGDSPVKKAKDHNKTRSSTERKYRMPRHLRTRGFRKRRKKPKVEKKVEEKKEEQSI